MARFSKHIDPTTADDSFLLINFDHVSFAEISEPDSEGLESPEMSVLRFANGETRVVVMTTHEISMLLTLSHADDDRWRLAQSATWAEGHP